MAVFRLVPIDSPTATGTVTYAHDLGVVPKAALVVATLPTLMSSLNSVQSLAGHVLGVTDGTTQRCISWGTAGAGVTKTQTSRVYSDSFIHAVYDAGTTLVRASLSSWTATALTLNWTTVTTNARRLYVLLIGGDDVQARVRAFSSPTATGDQTLTGVGFAPDCALFLNAGDFSNSTGTPQTGAAWGIGAASRTSSQWALALSSAHNVSPTVSRRTQRTDSAVWGLTSTGSLAFSATVQSWDSDGITLNWAIVQSAARPLAALFLKGVPHAIGAFRAVTSATTQTVSGLGFRPDALLLATWWNSASTSIRSHAWASVGLATSPTTEASANAYDQDNASPTVSHRYQSTNRILVKHTSSVSRTCDLTSFDGDGFTLSWDATGTADELLYLALSAVIAVDAAITSTASGLVTPILEASATATTSGTAVGVLDTTLDAQSDAALIGSADGTLTATVTPVEQRAATLSGATAGALSAALDGNIAAPVVDDVGGVLASALDVAATSSLVDHGSGALAHVLEAAVTESIADRASALIDSALDTYRTELGALRLDVGAPNAEPTASIFPVLRCTFEWALNDVGKFSAQVAITTPYAEVLDAGREVRIVREGEGEVFRGLIASRRIVLEDDGPVIEVEGYSTARELAYRTTQLNWRVANEPLGTAAASLVAGTGWTTVVDSAVADQLVTAEFQGVTRIEALTALAQQAFQHVRIMPVDRVVEITKGERPSGFRCVLLPEYPYERDDKLLPIRRVRVSRRDEDIVTRVIPLGAGEGPNALTLRWSTRTSPYPIQTTAGPDGGTIWYIEDSAAASQYGVRERVVVFKDVAPLANSHAELERAANVLYDLAAAWLQARASPRVEWAVNVLGPLRQRDPLTGAWLLMPGDTVQLIARGIVEDYDQKRVFVDIDTTAYVRGIERRFEGDREEVSLTLTDSSRVVRDSDLLADVVHRLWAVSVAQKTVPVREIHGPFRQTIDQNKPVRMTVDWDENVRFLHQAKLVLVCRRIRANATTAAAGGGQTSSGGSAHSHSVSGQTAQSGGGQTSSGGSAHSHSVSGQTAQSSGAHRHSIGLVQNAQTWATPPYMRGERHYIAGTNSYVETMGGDWSGSGAIVEIDTISQGTHEHAVTGATSSSESSHTHTVSNHTHTVSATTSSSESSHTHTVSDHTHTVSATTSSSESSHTHTVSNHTHPLEYGIFEGTYPTAKALRVLVNGTDVTTALGGPWDPSEQTPLVLDVTAWLQEPDGRPKQQRNTIEVQAQKLFDVELVVKSLVAIATVVPV